MQCGVGGGGRFCHELCLSGADPGFSVGGGADPGVAGGANIRFCQIFRKTAWNQKNFWGGDAGVTP